MYRYHPRTNDPFGHYHWDEGYPGEDPPPSYYDAVRMPQPFDDDDDDGWSDSPVYGGSYPELPPADRM